jgi:hypothetical protein
MMMDVRSVLIGILAVVAVALAVVVYRDRQNAIEIRLPSVKIERQ